jgi:hypothetical protein
MERAEYQGPPGQDPKELFEVWEREQVNDSIWRSPNTKEFSIYAETIEFLIDTVPFATSELLLCMLGVRGTSCRG